MQRPPSTGATRRTGEDTRLASARPWEGGGSSSPRHDDGPNDPWKPTQLEAGRVPRRPTNRGLQVDAASVAPSMEDERLLANALALAVREAARLRMQRAATLRVIEGKHGGPDGSTQVA